MKMRKNNQKKSNNKVLRGIIAIAAALVTIAGVVILFLKRRSWRGWIINFMLITVVIFSVVISVSPTFAYTDPEETETTEISTEPTTRKSTSAYIITEQETTEIETTAGSETETDVIIEPETSEEIEIDVNEFLNADRRPLTPPGNLTLVDDLSGEQSEDKQFITVTTKSGNYFYMIIDRVNDKDNVHFLNLVDEADLLAILEDEKTEKPTKTAEPAPEPTSTSEPKPEPKKTNTTGLLIMLVVIAAVGGGAFYYFKVMKPKQGASKNTEKSELDEFEFDADEDDFITINTGEGQKDPEYDGETDEDMPDFTAESEDNE
jgi:cytoskeletal protein RodZ